MRGKKIGVSFLAVFFLFAGAQAADKKKEGVRTVLPQSANAGNKSTMPHLPLETGSILSCQYGLDYKPLPAFEAPNYTKVVLSKNGKVETKTEAWPTNQDKKNALLPNIATSVGIVDLGGSANFAGVFSGSAKQKQIIIDFMKYRTEPVIEGTQNKVLMYSRVGAGMRLEINISTTEASLDASLFAIAASAKAGKTTGSISVDVIGVNAPEVTLSMPFTSDLSEGSIQKIIEALAIVKSKLHDPNTTLSPQFIARVDCKPKPEGKNEKKGKEMESE